MSHMESDLRISLLKSSLSGMPKVSPAPEKKTKRVTLRSLAALLLAK